MCGEERQKEFIETIYKDTYDEFGIPFTESIKFCIDKTSCFFEAEKVRLTSKKVKE